MVLCLSSMLCNGAKFNTFNVHVTGTRTNISCTMWQQSEGEDQQREQEQPLADGLESNQPWDHDDDELVGMQHDPVVSGPLPVYPHHGCTCCNRT